MHEGPGAAVPPRSASPASTHTSTDGFVVVDEDVVVGLEQLTLAMEKTEQCGGPNEEVASEAGESDHGVMALSETGSDAGKSEHKSGGGCESDSERYEVIDGVFDSKSVGSWSDLAGRSDNEEDIYETISLADNTNADDHHPGPEPSSVTTLTTGDFFQYDVHREDTLQGICVRWSVSMRDLRKLNIGLTKDSDLRSCTVLNIPVIGPEDKVRRQAQSLVLALPEAGLTEEKARYYLKAAGYSYEMALSIASDEVKAEKETEAAQEQEILSIENRMKEMVDAHVKKVKDAAKSNLAQQCNDNLAPAVNWLVQEFANDLDYFRNSSEFLDRWS